MTNKGGGFVTEAIRDYNGNFSKNLRHLLEKDGLEPYENHLVEFKKYCLDQEIIFNTGMASHNFLLRRISPYESKLILIDGLGDWSYSTILDFFKPHFRAKLLRR